MIARLKPFADTGCPAPYDGSRDVAAMPAVAKHDGSLGCGPIDTRQRDESTTVTVEALVVFHDELGQLVEI